MEITDLPILIYQPGRSGSKTIERTLTRNGIPSIPIHCLTWKGIFNTIKLYPEDEVNHIRQVVRRTIDAAPDNVRWKVITIVREPVARACSGAFESRNRYFPHAIDQPDQMFAAIMAHVYSRLKDLYTEETMMDTWFDREMKEVFEYDIFSIPFDRSQGFQIYKAPHADILLFKSEQLSECFQQGLSLFLGRSITQLHNCNMSKDKPDAPMYDKAKRELKLPLSHLRQIYSKRYVKHCYTPDQIEGFIRKWADMEPLPQPATNKNSMRLSGQNSKISLSQQVQRSDHVQPIAISPEGEIYITGNAVVQRFDDEGKKVEDIILEAQPTSLAAANNTRMYVGMKDHVQVYEGGRPIARWASLGQKAVLTNIVIDGPDIFVADAGNGIIIRYDQYGNMIGHTLAKHEDWNAPESMMSPPYFSLAVDSQKNAKMIRYEAPGHYKRIYQYHIRKTGGTSLNYMFCSLGGDPGGKVSMGLTRSDSRRGLSNGIAFAARRKSVVEQGNYYYAHSHTPMHQYNFPPDTFTITILRDPVKRIISHYRMLMEMTMNNVSHPAMKTEGPWLGNSFCDFLRNIHNDHLLRQLYMFSENCSIEEAFDNIITRCNYFFFTEEFTAGVAELSLLLGIKLTPIHIRKSTINVEIKESDKEYLRNLLQKEYDLIEKLREFKNRNTPTSSRYLTQASV